MALNLVRNILGLICRRLRVKLALIRGCVLVCQSEKGRRFVQKGLVTHRVLLDKTLSGNVSQGCSGLLVHGARIIETSLNLGLLKRYSARSFRSEEK